MSILLTKPCFTRAQSPVFSVILCGPASEQPLQRPIPEQLHASFSQACRSLFQARQSIRKKVPPLQSLLLVYRHLQIDSRRPLNTGE